MKAFVLCAALALSTAAAAQTTKDEIVGGIAKAFYHEGKISTPHMIKWLEFCAANIISYTAALGIPDQAKMVSAMIYVESRYDPRARNGDSVGLGQVRAKYRQGFLAELRRLGKIPKDADQNPPGYEAQIAAAVGAYHVFLDKYKLPWFAVMRYNGQGWMARRHRRRVWNAYFKMYGVWP